MSLTKVSYSMIEGACANVLDFGAVGDGVADDTAAIQAALNTGKSVFIPAGVYKVTSLLQCLPSTIVYGEGSSNQPYVPTPSTGTILLNKGTTFTISLASGSQIRDLSIWGAEIVGTSSTAAGGIFMDLVGVGQVQNVTVCGFTALNAVAIRMNNTSRIKLSYMYIFSNYTAFKFSGYNTTFEFDKGNIARTNDFNVGVGKAIDATDANWQQLEAYFNTVYFEACYGSEPIVFSKPATRATFTNCGFEAMCVAESYAVSIADPKVIRADNPVNITLRGCQFSSFITTLQTYTGTLSFLSASGGNHLIDNCTMLQNFALGALTYQFVSGIGIASLALTNNIFSYNASNILAEGTAIYAYSDQVYFQRSYVSQNNKITMGNGDFYYHQVLPVHDVAPSNYGGSASIVTATGIANTIIYTTTIPRYTLFGNRALKLTAWGRRTGTAGTKQIQVNFGTINIAATEASTAANSWRLEIVIVGRYFNSQSVSTLAFDASTPLLTNQLTTQDFNAAERILSLTALVAGSGDTVTLDGCIVERLS